MSEENSFMKKIHNILISTLIFFIIITMVSCATPTLLRPLRKKADVSMENAYVYGEFIATGGVVQTLVYISDKANFEDKENKQQEIHKHSYILRFMPVRKMGNIIVYSIPPGTYELQGFFYAEEDGNGNQYYYQVFNTAHPSFEFSGEIEKKEMHQKRFENKIADYPTSFTVKAGEVMYLGTIIVNISKQGLAENVAANLLGVITIQEIKDKNISFFIEDNFEEASKKLASQYPVFAFYKPVSQFAMKDSAENSETK